MEPVSRAQQGVTGVLDLVMRLWLPPSPAQMLLCFLLQYLMSLFAGLNDCQSSQRSDLWIILSRLFITPWSLLPASLCLWPFKQILKKGLPKKPPGLPSLLHWDNNTCVLRYIDKDVHHSIVYNREKLERLWMVNAGGLVTVQQNVQWNNTK